MKDEFKGAGINAKHCYIQTHLRVPKDNEVKNYQGRTQYTYRNLATIFEKVKPLLEDTGCTLRIEDDEPIVVGADIQPVFEVEKDKFGNEVKHMILGPHVYIRSRAILTDIEDGKTVSAVRQAREAEYRKGMDPSQLSGSVSSYSGKYACEALFGLDGSDDADAIASRDMPKDDQQSVKPSQSMQHVKTSNVSVCPCGKAKGKTWKELDTDTLKAVLATPIEKAPYITASHRNAIIAELSARAVSVN